MSKYAVTICGNVLSNHRSVERAKQVAQRASRKNASPVAVTERSDAGLLRFDVEVFVGGKPRFGF